MSVRAAVAADTRLTVFEFALVRLLDAQLGARPPRAVPIKHYSLDAVRDPITRLLSVLARAGAQNTVAAAEAFARASKPFAFNGAALAAASACTLVALESALRELAALSPLLKRNVITACADCVIHDGKITPSEAELIETVALALDCPLPPLLAA